ncbi:unnamed protein product [Trichogramma brassicae]|uniref:Uncharacterized protein n=1 Tax=Trichogramma brassicae TaxID=86971 RepID=A0A6H5I1T7_9HYME|nr:unnamed protein product [Trichogramma brassicae]
MAFVQSDRLDDCSKGENIPGSDTVAGTRSIMTVSSSRRCGSRPWTHENATFKLRARIISRAEYTYSRRSIKRERVRAIFPSRFSRGSLSFVPSICICSSIACVCCFAMMSENAQVRESRIFGSSSSSSAGVAARDLHLAECTKYETRALTRSCARALLQITNVLNVRYINRPLRASSMLQLSDKWPGRNLCTRAFFDRLCMLGTPMKENQKKKLCARETLCAAVEEHEKSSVIVRVFVWCTILVSRVYIYIYICQERRQ